MMRLAPLFLAALLACPALAQGGPGTPPAPQADLTADYQKIEALQQKLGARPPAEERDRLLGELRVACGEFLDAHSAAAEPLQLLTASRLWFGLSLRQPDLAPVRARLAALRARQDLSPKLVELLTTVESDLRAAEARAGKARPAIVPGAKAPAWTGRDLATGAEVTLESFKGKVVLVDFWATWCAPCVRFMAEELAPLHARYGEVPGFALVGFGVSTNDTEEKQRARLAGVKGVHWQKVFESGAGTLERYGSEELPHLCLIDADGTIVVNGLAKEVIGKVKEELARRFPDAKEPQAGAPATTEGPKSEPPKTEPPKTEPPKTEPPTTEARAPNADAPPAMAIAKGKKAPAFSATDIHTGAEVTLESRKGKVVLLDFWATWCAPCVLLAERELAPLQARYKDVAGFELIGIGVNETPVIEKEFAEEKGHSWTKVLDASNRTLEAYGIDGVPVLVLVDGEGTILVAGQGWAVIEEVKAELARRFGEAPKPEAPKPAAPKPEPPKPEAPKAAAPKTEAPKTEAPKTDPPMVEAPKTEAPPVAAVKATGPSTFVPGLVARGKKAPSWTAQDVRTGAELTLESLRGKVVLMDFWATWCPPCVALMQDELAPLHARYEGVPGFELVGIGVNEAPEAEAAFAEAKGLHWTKVLDPTNQALEAYDVMTIPFLVLVDGEGTILVAGPGFEVIGEVKAELARRFGGVPSAPTRRHAVDGPAASLRALVNLLGLVGVVVALGGLLSPGPGAR